MPPLRDYAVRAARDVAAREVANTTDRRRGTIRNLMRQSIAEGWTQTMLKERLAEVVGLDTRQQQAVMNYRRGLEAKYPGQAGRVSTMTKQYAARLRRQRVQRIARQERENIMAEARRRKWATEKPDRLRQWVTKDPCPMCLPYNGQVARPGEPYAGGALGPPLHPNCKCGEELL